MTPQALRAGAFGAGRRTITVVSWPGRDSMPMSDTRRPAARQRFAYVESPIPRAKQNPMGRLVVALAELLGLLSVDVAAPHTAAAAL